MRLFALASICVRSCGCTQQVWVHASYTGQLCDCGSCSVRGGGTRVKLLCMHTFKSFLTGSQDLKVNLCGLQQDKHSDGNGKNNDVGIAGRFPCYSYTGYSYTVGPYGKGPTGDYTTCTYSN